jgi:hypothetical protein
LDETGDLDCCRRYCCLYRYIDRPKRHGVDERREDRVKRSRGFPARGVL